jgi:hypothetical protein
LYRLAEIQPLDTNVDNYLDYTKQVQLDRVAISNEKLKLVQQGGRRIGLRLLPSDRLRPVQIELTFSNEAGDTWKIGRHDLPQSIVIDIEKCIKEKKCESQADGVIYIPLLGIVVDDLHLISNDPELTAGKIGFKVRFRYNAGEVYHHHSVDTGKKNVNIQPVKYFLIPESQFFTEVFKKIVLDNETLTNEYEPSQDSENGLTQSVARARIVAAREAYQKLVFVIAMIVALALLTFILFLFYKFAYQRRFQPRLGWHTAKKIDMDFNQQHGARLLVGTLSFMNDGRIPWFGRLLANTDYPDYKVAFTLGYRNEQLVKYGFILSDNAGSPLGFRGIGEGTALSRQIKLRVSHETPIYIFLATDVIKDFLHPHQSFDAPTSLVTFGKQEKDFQISLDMWRDKERVLSQGIDFDIELIPEEPRLPRVIYQASREEFYFDKGQSINIGTFRFESQAKHRFSRAYKGHFDLRSYQDNLPLPDNTMTLRTQNENIVVSPFDTSNINIDVLCDGEVIPNPEPPSQDYSFNLIGEFAPGSAPGSHWFSLRRDPIRADIHLDIIHCKTTHRIHWEQQGEQFDKVPTCRLMKDRIVETKLQLLDQARLDLPKHPLIKFDSSTPASTIFEIQVGNTGKAGNGWVKVNLGLELKLAPALQRSITCVGRYSIQDSVRLITNHYQGVYQGNELITLMEGDPVESILVQLDPATTIEEIIGGRIDPDYGHIEATLNIEVQDDMGNQRYHQLDIHVSIGLEKLPHQNWLCIDFGTSAIVAAIGTSKEPYFLPLQKLIPVQNPALNLEDYDLNNAEQGTDFLPSQIVCDADLRQGDTQDEQIRKGFPRYQPASLKPGAPDFIGLPAIQRRLRENSGRIVYSLKSWLAQPTDTIYLAEEVELLNRNDRVLIQNKLPLEEVVESSFAALAEAYITAIPIFQKGGQVVLTHPNTFTSFHRDKLHRIAWKALTQPLGIALPERIRLISESDAVAYHYCRQRMSENRRRTGAERLLIYDFGAGTLDLSLIHVHWNPEGVYPDVWHVENRLGIPIAGNYLDSLLARLVDKCLRDESILDPAMFEYRYPVVDRQLRHDDKENHRGAIYRLWQEIRESKHVWNGKEPFRVRVGGAGAELIYYKGESTSISSETDSVEPSEVEQADSENQSALEKPVIEPSGNNFYLSIPSSMVHHDSLLEEFVEFVTDTVVDELLEGAKKTVQAVDTVVVSGRGALWAGLRERVWNKFPDSCEKPDLKKSGEVKSAVVSGAIAWQDLVQNQEQHDPETVPRLAILREQDKILVPEEDWEMPIDLKASSTFSLVQISHSNPMPTSDLKSLHRYFYIQLAQLRREWKWADDPRLFVHRKARQGQQSIIRVENAQGDGYDFTGVGSIGLLSVPPWPIGRVVLSPDDLYC